MKTIIGKKVGMTQIFDEKGKVIPVTVIEAGPCVVSQVKTVETDGYNAIQLGFEDVKESKINKPEKGHFAKANIAPKKHLREFRVDEIEEGVTATEESVKSMTDALMRYGDESVKASIKAGKLINPMEAIVSLQKAWKNDQISEADLFQISKDVAGQRYYNVFTALIQNPEMYNEMLQSIAQSTGSAQREIDALMDSWSKKLERLKTTWTEIVNRSISEGFIKDLIDGGTAALEFAGSLENLATMAGGALRTIRIGSALPPWSLMVSRILSTGTLVRTARRSSVSSRYPSLRRARETLKPGLLLASSSPLQS